MNILIIEDETYAQQELMRLLRQTGRDIEVLACLDTVSASVRWLRDNHQPDLVFMDIQLADGLSFDILSQVKIQSPVIFTTAYDEYAIQAFKLNSIDYLLKPVKLEELKAALDKLDSFQQHFAKNAGHLFDGQLDMIREMLSGAGYKSRFLARLGDQVKSVKLGEIAYFKAEDNVVFMMLNEGKRLIIDHSLEQLEGMLDPSVFFRLNRSYLVKIDSIRKAHKYFNSRMLVELSPDAGEQVLVSRIKVKKFLDWMEQ